MTLKFRIYDERGHLVASCGMRGAGAASLSSRSGTQSQDDRKSIISGGSSAASTLVADSVASSRISTTTSQLRKFTAGVGRPGLAREAREAVRNVITTANPTRKPPLSLPLDYEQFVREKSIYLENDPQRELLLFPRDDIEETSVQPDPSTVIPSVCPDDIKKARWLLTREALKLYTSPYSSLIFNYSKFSGDYNTVNEGSSSEVDVALSSLVFESDMAVEEERAALEGFFLSDVIKEGWLLVVKTDPTLLDNLKAEKRRYCVLKRIESGEIALQVLKSPGAPPSKPALIVNSAQLKSTKKGKTVLEVEPCCIDDSNEVKSLTLAAEGGMAQELNGWLQLMNRAIALANKGDSVSSSSDYPEKKLSRQENIGGDNESVHSEDSAGTTGSREGHWRGRSSAARALQPPIVDRRNLFSLYYQLAPVSDPRGEPCSILSRSRHSSSSTGTSPTSTLSSNVTPTRTGPRVTMADRSSAARFLIEFRRLDLRLPVGATQMEQIEPFFVHLFIFDVSSGRRMSEVFHIDVNDDSLNMLWRMGRDREYSECVNQEVNGIPRALLSSPTANRALCTVATPHKDLWVVVRVDRILHQDVQGELYLRNSGDVKSTVKLQKSVQSACSRLGQYRTRFAWAARPIFSDARTGDLSSKNSSEKLPLFRCENNRLTEQDLQKYLQDYSKMEKTSKTVIPGAGVSLRIELTTKIADHPFRVSPSLLPLRPWLSPRDSPIPPLFELQSFGDVVAEPHNQLVNLLYVYPLSLKYDNQKVFGKARNISCTVRFVRGGDPTSVSKQSVFDRLSPGGPIVSHGSCCVQHHQQTPNFSEEIKMSLPLSLDPFDHILFSFAHVSVAGQSNPKSPHESVESSIGYAWLPLVGRKDRLTMESDEQEFALTVAAELPPHYYKSRPLGLGKGEEGAEVRWIDQKPLFRVRMRIVSSAFSTEPKLHSFFQACQRMESKGVIGDATELTKSPSMDSSHRSCSPLARSSSIDDHHPLIKDLLHRTQAISEVSTDKLIPFLPVVLGRLFALLPTAPTDNLAIITLTSIISLCDRISSSHRNSLLRSFVRLHFITHPKGEETTHAAITKHLPALLRSVSSSNDDISMVYRQLWFLFDITVKSMGQTVVKNGLYKSLRADRFPSDLVDSICILVETLVPQYIAKHREMAEESRKANTAVANLLRCCLSLMDRGSVFRWIHFIIQKMDESDSRILREYKWDLLCILCQHEHFLPLCLPVLVDGNDTIQRVNYQSTSQEATAANATNTGGFLTRFINQIFYTPSLGEQNETDRYSQCSDEWWLSVAYCMRHFPIGLLLQELCACLREPREYRKKPIALLRNLLAKHSMDRRYADANLQRRIAVLYSPVIRFALEHTADLEVSAFGEGNGEGSMAPNGGLLAASKWRSLDRRSTLVLPSNGSSLGSGGTRPTPPLPQPSSKEPVLTNIAPLAEKLDSEEVQDVLVCVLWVVHRLPKKILGLLFTDGDAVRAPQWLRLLELSLEVFRYRGRQHALNATTPIIRGSARTLLLYPPSSSSNRQSTDMSGMVDDDSAGLSAPLPFGVLQIVNLSQEVAMVVLDALQTFAQQLATKACAKLSCWEELFCRLLSLHLSLLEEHWPEAVRLHTIAALTCFINLFRTRLFDTGPLDALSLLIEHLLTQMASRLSSVQTAAAALLQFVLRAGFETAQSAIAQEALSHSVAPSGSSSNIQKRPLSAAERLGRPGAQTGVALARLLGSQKGLSGSGRFEKGLNALETLTHCDPKKASSFEKAVNELISQLRGVMTATEALVKAANDPIRLADLHIQLADSYRGSAALRSAWFDTLAESHSTEGWHSEAAVCYAHSVAIIAKELMEKGLIQSMDWSVLEWISDSIGREENVNGEVRENVQPAGFTLENLASKIERTARELTLSERFEAIGPLYRMLIPSLEKNRNFNSLRSVYAELNQSSSRALEATTSGKRHLGTYFRVLFMGRIHFGSDHDTEWVYREAGLTSLAEASTRLREYCRIRIGHDRIRIEPGNELDQSSLDPQFAYVQITHVDPLCGDERERLAFDTHTNISEFVYESPVIEGLSSNEKREPSIQDQALKRTVITVSSSFPSTRRRLRVISKRDQLFTPLEFACQKLRIKARQITTVLDGCCDGRQLDIKGLQLLLQGAVMPTVNAGPLAYAESFTQPEQRERYGEKGIEELRDAFRELMSCCENALQANGAAVGADQQTYHEVLVSSAEAMLERLTTYWPNFRVTPDDKFIEPPRSIHILDSIGGINT